MSSIFDFETYKKEVIKRQKQMIENTLDGVKSEHGESDARAKSDEKLFLDLLTRSVLSLGTKKGEEHKLKRKDVKQLKLLSEEMPKDKEKFIRVLFESNSELSEETKAELKKTVGELEELMKNEIEPQNKETTRILSYSIYSSLATNNIFLLNATLKSTIDKLEELGGEKEKDISEKFSSIRKKLKKKTKGFGILSVFIKNISINKKGLKKAIIFLAIFAAALTGLYFIGAIAAIATAVKIAFFGAILVATVAQTVGTVFTEFRKSSFVMMNFLAKSLDSIGETCAKLDPINDDVKKIETSTKDDDELVLLDIEGESQQMEEEKQHEGKNETKINPEKEEPETKGELNQEKEELVKDKESDNDTAKKESFESLQTNDDTEKIQLENSKKTQFKNKNIKDENQTKEGEKSQNKAKT